MGAPALHDVASGYAVCHVLDVARPLESVLSDLTHASYSASEDGKPVDRELDGLMVEMYLAVS